MHAIRTHSCIQILSPYLFLTGKECKFNQTASCSIFTRTSSARSFFAASAGLKILNISNICINGNKKGQQLTATKTATPKLCLSVSMPMFAQCLCTNSQLIGPCNSRRWFTVDRAKRLDTLKQTRWHLVQCISTSRRSQS